MNEIRPDDIVLLHTTGDGDMRARVMTKAKARCDRCHRYSDRVHEQPGELVVWWFVPRHWSAYDTIRTSAAGLFIPGVFGERGGGVRNSPGRGEFPPP